MSGDQLERQINAVWGVPEEEREAHLQRLLRVPDGQTVVQTLYNRAMGNADDTEAPIATAPSTMISVILRAREAATTERFFNEAQALIRIPKVGSNRFR